MNTKVIKIALSAAVILICLFGLYHAFESQVGDFISYLSRGKEEELEVISTASDVKCLTSDGLHLLQEFFVIHSSKYKDKMKWHSHNEDALKARQREIDSCLQKNLLHFCTSSITLFYDDSIVVDYIANLHLINEEKLVFVESDNDQGLNFIFSYINQHMVGKTVVVLRMDNVLGAGVEKIDAERFQKEDICSTTAHWKTISSFKITYSLSDCNQLSESLK